MNDSGQFGHSIPTATMHPGREAGSQNPTAAGYGYENYQAMPSAANNMSVPSMAASTTHSHNYSSEGDVPMEDADPYNRAKYPSRPGHQQRSSSHHITHEGSATAQRYSPMNMHNAAGQFTSSPKSQSQSQAGYIYQSQTPRSQQSPTRQINFGSPQQYHDSPSKHKSLRYHPFVRNVADYPPCLASARFNLQFAPQTQNADMSQGQYYASSPIEPLSGTRNGRSQMALRPQNLSFGRASGAVSLPKFQKVKSAQELHPRINSQPPFRRANPEGGFISVGDPYLSPHDVQLIFARTAATSLDDTSSLNLPDM